MSDVVPSEKPVPRGYPIVAWVVILGVIGFLVWRQGAKAVKETASWLVPMQAQSRYLVGVANLKMPGTTGKELYEQAKTTLDVKGYSQRLRLAVLAGELVGPAEARSVLEALAGDSGTQTSNVSAHSLEAAKLLLRLYSGYEKDPGTPALSSTEQDTLRDGLGWFGDLALAPADGDAADRARAMAPVYRTLVGYLCLGLGGLLALLTGVVLLLVLVCFLYLGRLGDSLVTGSGHGGLYAETFALYLVFYVVVGYSLRFVPEEWTGLWLQGVVMLLSLVTLGWPVLRGLSWQQVREDLGLHFGKQPYAEVLAGVGTYLSAVPALVVGLLVVAGMMFVARRFDVDVSMSRGGPTHPAMEVALAKGWWVWVQLFVVACVFAPVVEEIMFRGVLYRHLREGSQGWARWASVVFAAVLSSFLFAVIHPQGWFGVPPLMALALVFALAREWRQSLVSPMIAHGINNGVSTLMLLLMAS